MTCHVNPPRFLARMVGGFLALCMGVIAPVSGASAAGVEVVVSISPIHSLVAQVMAGVGTPRLLIPAGASPHGFALTPSQARALADAKVVIWIGPGLEGSLAKPITSLASGAQRLRISEVQELHRLKARSLNAIGKESGHDHGQSHSHDHGHGHDKEQGAPRGDDPHYWLDPENAKVMMNAIAKTLAAADPAGKSAYLANAAEAGGRLDGLVDEFKARLKPNSEKPFVVFHDAYQYLEARFGLKAEGVLAVDPDRPPGARHVTELRALLKGLGPVCLFTEPQFPSRIVDALTKGTAARIAVLDPLGIGLEPGPSLYADMLTANLRSLEGCLASLR